MTHNEFDQIHVDQKILPQITARVEAVLCEQLHQP